MLAYNNLDEFLTANPNLKLSVERMAEILTGNITRYFQGPVGT
jgi:hypothetical protein